MAETRRILHKLKITEISGVDNPCQEHARMTIMKRADVDEDYWKRDFTEDQRKAMADEGTAMPDGSFPIATVVDLRNAVSAIGRAKNFESARRHIIRRAKALDAVSSLPAAWNITKVTADARVAVLKARVASLQNSIRDFRSHTQT